MAVEAVRKRETIGVEDGLQRLVEDYLTQKQNSLMQMKKGLVNRRDFLQEAEQHVLQYYTMSERERRQLMREFEQYIFGYSKLSSLIFFSGNVKP